MPDHTDAPVTDFPARLMLRKIPRARFLHHLTRCSQRLIDRNPDRVELMIPGHLLDDAPAAFILEHDEVPHQIKEASLVEHAFEKHFEFRGSFWRDDVAVNRPPRHEPFRIRADRPDARLQAVGDHQHRVEGQQRRNILLVRLKLIERFPDVGVFIRRVLQLNHRQWQPVDENNHVRPPVRLTLDHRELIHHQPIVRVGIVPVHQPHEIGLVPVTVPVFHRHAVHEQLVKRAIVCNQRRMLRRRDLAERIIECCCRYLRIQRRQRIAQTASKTHFVPVGTFCASLFGGNVWAELGCVAELLQPVERG